jgi:UPF0755 protein
MAVKRKKKTVKNPGTAGKLLILGGLILLIIGGIKIYLGYREIYGPNVRIENGAKQAHLYIHSGADFGEVLSILCSKDLITDSSSFVWLAKKTGYAERIHPGHYIIENNMSNKALINLLKSGRQTPIKLRFQNIRTQNELAGVIAKQIEADSLSILRYLKDDALVSRFGLNHDNSLALFIPNTYEFYWNTETSSFIERMFRENKKFWNDDRMVKAEELGLSPVEVYILASIVDEECLYKAEEPIIAGVYMNRLHKGMRLQADPTVRFAVGDFTITRILKKHLDIDSPYNTYKYAGLPPGPIYLPSISAIDAVLSNQKNDYLYFCAKEDLSGHHNFSKNIEQHLHYARLYQRALNKRNIMN